MKSLSLIAVIFAALSFGQTDSFTSPRLAAAGLSGTSLKPQSGGRQIYGLKAKGIISAVVNFQDLARHAPCVRRWASRCSKPLLKLGRLKKSNTPQCGQNLQTPRRVWIYPDLECFRQ